MENREEKYMKLYDKINDEIVTLNIAEHLMKICSVSLDRTGIENQINLEFILGNSLDYIKQVKIRFDRYSKDLGFVMNYVNLSGDL